MKKRLKNYLTQETFTLELASVLLAGVLLSTVYSLFETPVIQVVLFGLLEAVLSIPFALLCHFTNGHRKLGTVICLLVYGGLLFGLSALSYPGYLETGESFVQWLVQDIEGVGWSMSYGLLLCIGGAMFFGTVIYYFTVVRYRMGMLVVVSIIPCVLYAKAVADVNNWYLVFIAGMNVIIAILRRKYDKIEESKNANIEELGEEVKVEKVVSSSRGFNAIMLSTTIVLIFTAVILAICAIIPKKSDAIYYDRFEDTFLGGDTNSQLMDASGALSDLSGNADGFRSDSNRRIYRINGEVSYLKRQCFDVYNFEQDRWYPMEEYATPICDNFEWSDKVSGVNVEKLQAAIRKAEELSPGFAAKYGLEEVVRGEKYSVNEASIIITALNFEAVYYVAPPGVKMLVPGDNTEAVATWAGTFTKPDGMHESDFSYSAMTAGNAQDIIEWCIGGGAVENSEIFKAMLDDMEVIFTKAQEKDSLSVSEREWATLQGYKWELENAEKYSSAVDFNTELIPDKVRELAEELTKNCVYDWEKAAALESYFHIENFVYDLRYYPPDNSVEYFLFNSKRGTCSDYATAYVLMARSVGLTVRYCEGYVAKQSGNSNIYYVKESNGHAFPEVYIPGAGWAVYEPTSGVVDDGGASTIWQKLLININMDYDLIMTIGIIVAVIAVIILIIRLIIPFIIEQVFISRLRKGTKSATDAYVKILKRVKHGRLKKKYRKLLKRDRLVKNVNPYSLSPAELNERFAEIGIDASVICCTVETSAYRPDDSQNSKQNEICSVYKKIIAIFK